MRELRRAAHTVYSLHYHFVFTTKYRKPVLTGEIGQSVRDLIREICRSEDIEILQGHVRPDHVHLLLSAPPHLAPSRVMQAIKGKTSHHLLQEYRRLRAAFWGRHLWGRGYFVASSGNVTDETIANIFGSKVPSPRTTTASKLARSEPAWSDSARLFSRLQSTQNPSPSGEGRSIILDATLTRVERRIFSVPESVRKSQIRHGALGVTPTVISSLSQCW